MGKQILLVEDDITILSLIKDILELMLGHEVAIATNGFDAIRLAKENQPDLILMDLSLPQLDGWEATRSLKSLPAFSNVPVLAVTAHSMVGDRERALDAGCDDYFPKPIEVSEFIEFLSPYLE